MWSLSSDFLLDLFFPSTEIHCSYVNCLGKVYHFLTSTFICLDPTFFSLSKLFLIVSQLDKNQIVFIVAVLYLLGNRESECRCRRNYWRLNTSGGWSLRRMCKRSYGWRCWRTQLIRETFIWSMKALTFFVWITAYLAVFQYSFLTLLSSCFGQIDAIKNTK